MLLKQQTKVSLQLVKKSVFAGVLIGLAGVASLLAPTPFVGAIFFSIGLISVILLSADLYTGKIALIHKSNLLILATMFVANCGGACLVGLLTMPLVRESAVAAISIKLATPVYLLLIKSMLCGMCVYLAVSLYPKCNNILAIALPVTIFVACGFNHCIADFFYMGASLTFSIKHLIICMLGNSLGAIILHKLN